MKTADSWTRRTRGQHSQLQSPKTMASYFTEDLFRFLQKLKRNNRREWFLQHKEEYEEVVHQPVRRFVAELAGPLRSTSPHLPCSLMFRIYRNPPFAAS